MNFEQMSRSESAFLSMCPERFLARRQGAREEPLRQPSRICGGTQGWRGCLRISWYHYGTTSRISKENLHLFFGYMFVLNGETMVPRGGIEPPTRGFSVRLGNYSNRFKLLHTVTQHIELVVRLDSWARLGCFMLLLPIPFKQDYVRHPGDTQQYRLFTRSTHLSRKCA
jgi:hypothetical protein